MKKTGFIIVTSCILMFSCTRQSQIVKNNSASSVVKDRTTQHIGKNVNQYKSYTPIKKSYTNVTDGETKKNSIVYIPTVNPTFKGTSSKHSYVQVEKSKEKIKISVEKMPLNEFINLVFGKTLKTSYFVDNNVQRRKDLISIKMEKSVNYKEFLNTVYGILARYNISVQDKAGTLFIVPGRTSHQIKVAQFIIGRNIPKYISDDKTIASIIPFYYINASPYKGLIQKLALSRTAQIGVVPGTNSFMITDKASNVREAIKIVNLFDRLTFEHKIIALISLDYLNPTVFADKLKKILPLEGIPVTNALSQPGIIIIPMPEAEAILVVAAKKEWINVVSFWKSKMDTVSALGNQARFFVYYPKNRRAVDLAGVFSQVSEKLTLNTKKPKTKKSRSFSISKKVEVVVDEGRNALVILAPPSEYEQIKNVLNRLDTLPKEVLVQVTIAEITLTNNLQYGIEWYLKHSGKYSGTLQTVGGLGIGASGLNYSIISDTAKFQALLNAYAHKNLVNVISSPRLVVLDNHAATINVGTQVPTVTSESTNNNVQDQGTTSLIRTISYRKTGVILNIMPTINSGGVLTLKLDQEVSEPQVNDTSKIDSPLILDRQISTSVVLRSGTTLLLGGLIKKNNSSTISKVPLLGDIPIIGNIFKTTSKGVTKTELIIEITPYIISNMTEAGEKTKNFESLIKWFKKESLPGYIAQ